MDAGTLSLPNGTHRWPLAQRSIPTEAEARAMAAARLRTIREAAGYTIRRWAAIVSEALGRRITPGMVEAWEDPEEAKPPTHWSFILLALAGPDAVEPISSTLFS